MFGFTTPATSSASSTFSFSNPSSTSPSFGGFVFSSASSTAPSFGGFGFSSASSTSSSPFGGIDLGASSSTASFCPFGSTTPHAPSSVQGLTNASIFGLGSSTCSSAAPSSSLFDSIFDSSASTNTFGSFSNSSIFGSSNLQPLGTSPTFGSGTESSTTLTGSAQTGTSPPASSTGSSFSLASSGPTAGNGLSFAGSGSGPPSSSSAPTFSFQKTVAASSASSVAALSFPSNLAACSAPSVPPFLVPGTTSSSTGSTPSVSVPSSSSPSPVLGVSPSESSSSALVTPSLAFSSSSSQPKPTAAESLVGSPYSSTGSCSTCSATYKKLSGALEVITGVEIGTPEGGQTFSSLSITSSPHIPEITKQLLAKYGDISRGSILKTAVSKLTFLQLVAEVVHRLCNHTVKTLGSSELQLLQGLADDAAAVGFDVEWLQQRLKQVTAASKFQKHLLQLDELEEQISTTMKSLMEMELHQIILKNELESINADLGRKELYESNLGEGLL